MLTIHQQNERIRLSMFRLLCFGLGLGALAWAGLCLGSGLLLSAVIPLGFLVITATNLAVCRATGSMTWCMRVQVLVSLVLPFIFQAALGGIEPSGMVMFWSFVALAGALTFQGRAIAIGWVAFEVLAVLYFTLYDPVIDIGDRSGSIDPVLQRRFLAFNVASVTILLFSIALSFVRVQGRMRKRLHEVRVQLEVTNTALEEQRTSTQHGLRYARQIQQALLPDLGTAGHLVSESKVFDRSLETVGGDSFWCGGHGDHHFIVILDCTGHGMPGAMLSMLLHGILNQLVYKDHETSASELIRHTQQTLDRMLHRERSGSKDGAEMAVLHFNEGNGTVTFCGLGCSLIHTHQEQAEVLRGQRALPSMMQGWNGLVDAPLKLDETSRLHLFTDGIVDQFDPEQRVKFSLKRLVSMLKQQANKPMEEATSAIQHGLHEWRGNADQVDDMLLIALKPAEHWVKKSVPVAEAA